MQDIDTRILYIEDCFAVVNKHIGEICETGDNEYSLTEICKPVLESKLGRQLAYIEAVHRIDRPVSGCVILAFDQATAAALSEQFTSNRVKKRYDAIVEMRISRSMITSGRLEHYVLFDNKKQKAFIQNEKKPRTGYKRAVLSWEAAGFTDNFACLRVFPETGRTHQIRVQLAAAGMPIKGDLKYGAKRSERGGGIRLHARRIQFVHPGNGETLTITAPVENPDSLWSAFPGETE